MNANILDLIGSFSSLQPEIVAQHSCPTVENKSKNKKKTEAIPSVKGGDISECKQKSIFSVVIFSKDRPFQLHSLLLSMETFFSDAPCLIFVIYTASNSEWMKKYDAVFGTYSETVTPILETTFSQNVEECFHQIYDKSENGSVMLCVDDLIFYDTVSLRYE